MQRRRYPTYRFMWVMLTLLLFAFSSVAEAQNNDSRASRRRRGMQANDSALLATPDSIDAVNQQQLMQLESPIVIDVKNADSIQLPKQWIPNPTKATWMALVFPGGGQIYNKKYWKLPIFYAGFAGCAYALTWNNRMYKDYAAAYKDAVNNVINALQNQFGSIRAIPLNTSGPFHSPIMAPAIIDLEKFFCDENVKFTEMKIPVMSNVYAFPFDNTDQIQSELIRQMVSTVRWRESMEIIANDNEIDTIVEVAPGKILTSMFKREYNNANTFNLDTIDSIEKFMRYTQDNPTNTFEKFRN